MHLRQDPQSTLWSSDVVPLFNAEKMITFNGYSTQMHLETTDGFAAIDEEVMIESSEWVSVTINGKDQVLAPDAPVRVSPDAMGNIVVTQPVDLTVCDGSNVHRVNPGPIRNHRNPPSRTSPGGEVWTGCTASHCSCLRSTKRRTSNGCSIAIHSWI